MRGILVCVCGPDASGKSTLVSEFMSKNQDWYLFKFPDRSTVIGRKIDKLLKGQLTVSKDTEIKLFADNRAEFRTAIISLLAAGKNVMLDRYAYCGIAYSMTLQCSEAFNNRDISVKMTIDDMIKLDKDNLKPDLAVLVTSDYSHMRDPGEREKYDLIDRKALLGNYIQAFINTKTCFTVIENEYTDLKRKIDQIQKNQDKFVRFIS